MNKILFLFLIFAFACGPKEERQFPYIVTTTGMIADAVKNIGGDSVAVEALMGPGVDPHLYKASQGDLSKLKDAAIIFYNGLHLEGKMGEVLEKLSRQKPVIPVTKSIPDSLLLTAEDYPDAYDPHVWFDLSLWSYVIEEIYRQLAEISPSRAPYYEKRLERYRKEVLDLHEEVKKEIASIPEKQRVLITAHDAFGYFGEAYDIEVKGLQGISTLSEYGLKDVTSLVDYITQRNIKAVFVETSVSDRSIRSVLEGAQGRGHELKIGGNLYSDAMGPEGSGAGTYIGMVKENVETIVNALK